MEADFDNIFELRFKQFTSTQIIQKRLSNSILVKIIINKYLRNSLNNVKIYKMLEQT